MIKKNKFTSNMYISTMPLEKVTFDIYMYLPCTDLNLKTTLKNIFKKNDLQFLMKKNDNFV